MPDKKQTKTVRVYGDMDTEIELMMREHKRSNKQDFYDEIFSTALLYWNNISPLDSVPDWRTIRPRKRAK